MDEIRVEFVHIERLFHVRRGAEAGELWWRGGVVAEAGAKYGKAATLLSRGLLGVRMKGDRRWAGYLGK